MGIAVVLNEAVTTFGLTVRVAARAVGRHARPAAELAVSNGGAVGGRHADTALEVVLLKRRREGRRPKGQREESEEDLDGDHFG